MKPFQLTFCCLASLFFCSCGNQSLFTDFSTPQNTIHSLFSADYHRQAEALMACFSGDYFTAFGITKDQMLERMKASFDQIKSRVSYDQIKIVNETQDRDRVRIEYVVTDNSKQKLVWGEKLAYLLKKTPEGWKVYGADSFDGTHWRLTEEADPYQMRPLEELLHHHEHDDIPTS